MSLSGFLSSRVKDFLFHFFFKNKRLKLLAFCFAIIVWGIATVSLKKNVTEIVLPVVLTYTDPPENLIIKNTLPNKANTNLFVRGLSDFNRSDFNIRVDISGIRSGNTHINLKEQNHNFPENTEFFSIEPSFINVIAEEASNKQVPVKLIYEGKLKDGFKLSNIAVNPEQIWIKGPKSIIDQITQVETEVIDLQNEDKSFNRVATPILPQFFKLINENDRNLSITGQVTEIIIKKRIKNIQVETFDEQYKTVIKPNKIDIILSGTKQALENINAEHVKGYFDVGSLTPGTHTATDIILELPQHVKVVSFDPIPKIKVSKQKIKTP